MSTETFSEYVNSIFEHLNIETCDIAPVDSGELARIKEVLGITWEVEPVYKTNNCLVVTCLNEYNEVLTRFPKAVTSFKIEVSQFSLELYGISLDSIKPVKEVIHREAPAPELNDDLAVSGA